jgi:hypothetical protein
MLHNGVDATRAGTKSRSRGGIATQKGADTTSGRLNATHNDGAATYKGSTAMYSGALPNGSAATYKLLIVRCDASLATYRERTVLCNSSAVRRKGSAA